jgi:hypothetical protein
MDAESMAADKTEKTKLLTVRMSEPEWERLERVAERKDMNQSELVRALLVREDRNPPTTRELVATATALDAMDHASLADRGDGVEYPMLRAMKAEAVAAACASIQDLDVDELGAVLRLLHDIRALQEDASERARENPYAATALKAYMPDDLKPDHMKRDRKRTTKKGR